MKPGQMSQPQERYDYFLAIAMMGFIQQGYTAKDAAYWGKKAADEVMELTKPVAENMPKPEAKLKKT